MAVLIGNRTDVVRSALGHAIGFEKGKEVQVPDIPDLIRACLERGHVVKEVKSAPKPKVTEDTSK